MTMTGARSMARDSAPSVDSILRLTAGIFPTAQPFSVEYLTEGISTFVYRIVRGDERFYLRVLPEADASFAPEVRVHALLRERGVRVPEVVYFEHRNELLGLSVMLTTEIAGESIASRGLDEDLPTILFAAGRDLALVNSVPVAGFGWIARDQPVVAALAADLPTNRAFLAEHLNGDLAALRAHGLDAAAVASIEAIIARYDAWLGAERATLAHGDFDATHIYAHEGVYSGIIDCGELRGTDRWYDLGHFRLHDGELVPTMLLPWLLAGYRTVTPLPDDAERRIAFASLLIGIRTLTRTLARHPTSPLIAHCLRALRRDITFLGGA
jgi:aminoglycoside phosphotransferase (APT) family kinase protein